jgi:hypothetical protein
LRECEEHRARYCRKLRPAEELTTKMNGSHKAKLEPHWHHESSNTMPEYQASAASISAVRHPKDIISSICCK